jgi:SNF2 family DNA or RNA helicase
MTATPFVHQEDGIRWLIERETTPMKFGAECFVYGGLLCDNMGMGKTLQLTQLIVRRPQQRTLIVTPLSVLGQWRDCLFANAPGFTIYVCISRKTAKIVRRAGATDGAECLIASIPATTPTIVLASYGQVMIPAASARTGAKPFPDSVWDRIILDEAHTIKNSKTQTFGSVHELRATPTTARWAVTGTPVQNRIGDVYSLFGFIGVPDQLLRHKSIPAANWLFAKLAIRRTVADLTEEQVAIIQFPEAFVSHESVVVYETEEEAEFYGRITRDIMSQFERLARYPDQRLAARCRLELINQLRYLAIHPQVYVHAVNNQRKNQDQELYPDWTGTVTKNLDVMRLVEQFRTEGKSFVMFTHFTEEMVQFEDAISALGYTVFKIHGGQSASAREEEIARSRQGSSSGSSSSRDEIAAILEGRLPAELAAHISEYATPLQAMLIHIRAGGAGLNLQHFSNIIIPSPDWNPAAEEQAIGRCHRIGQKMRVNVYRFFIGEVQNVIDQIELYMRRRQEEKLEIAEAIITPDVAVETTPEGVKLVRMIGTRVTKTSATKIVVAKRED